MKFRTGEPGNSHMIFDKEGSEPFVRMSLRLSEAEYQAIVNCGQLDITIEPVKSREERLREARLSALYHQLDLGEIGKRAVEIIERVDAEFAKGEK